MTDASNPDNDNSGEFLIYAAPDGKTRIEVRMQAETVWLTQKQLAELFQTSKQNVSLHLQNVFDEGELAADSTVKKYLTVQTEELYPRVSHSISRLRKTAVGDPRQHAKAVGENFVWILCGSETFRRYVNSVKTSTSIPHISGGQIKSLSFVRPPKGDDRIFHEFENIVSAFANQHDKNASESASLRFLRDTLLPQLLSGELRVREIWSYLFKRFCHDFAFWSNQ